MITKAELTNDIAAAILAYSNMGFGAPEEDKVRWLIDYNEYRKSRNLNGVDAEMAITHFASHLIETDEMLEMFHDEANAWAQFEGADNIERAARKYQE